MLCWVWILSVKCGALESVTRVRCSWGRFATAVLQLPYAGDPLLLWLKILLKPLWVSHWELSSSEFSCPCSAFWERLVAAFQVRKVLGEHKSCSCCGVYRRSRVLIAQMAFEVARVHGIIRSNIREDGSCISKATETAGSLVQEEAALSCAKATQLTGVHLSYLPRDLHLLKSSAAAAAAAACWPDVPSSPLTSSSSPRSTETESIGDDDLLAALVEQVAQTMLEGDEGLNQRPRRSSARTHSEASAPSTSDMEANKVRSPNEFVRVSCISSLFPEIFIGCRLWVASWFLLLISVHEYCKWQAVGSPQSSWSSGSSSSGHSWLSTSNAASSKGSSRVSSQVSSPPTTPVDPQQGDAWDLLYAAAGEVVRLKRNEQQQQKRPLSSFPVSRYHQQHVQSQHQPQAFLLQQQVSPSQIGAGGGGSSPGLQMVAAARSATISSSLAPHYVPPSLNNRSDRIAVYGSDSQHCWNSTSRVVEDRRLHSSYVSAIFSCFSVLA